MTECPETGRLTMILHGTRLLVAHVHLGVPNSSPEGTTSVPASFHSRRASGHVYRSKSTLPSATSWPCILIYHVKEMVTNIVHICQGFLNIGPRLPLGPEQYFGDNSRAPFVIKSCLFDAQTLLFDALMVSGSGAPYNENSPIIRYIAPTLYGTGKA